MDRQMEELLSAEEWPVRAGDAADDFDALVRQHQRRIFRLLMSMLRDEEAAETLTQETFLRAYSKRGDFRGDGSMEGWLMRIAVNLARDHIRSRRAGFWRRLLGGEPAQLAAEMAADPQPSAERVLLAREQAAAVWQIADELSPQQRAIFALRFVDEMPLEEIARTMGLRVGTVKAHLSRAVTKLRERLKQQGKPQR
jgi:RNA polymerase sigma-70 factor, ECF subfamily